MSSTPPKRPRRRRRRAVLLSGLVLLAAGLVILTRPVTLRKLILPAAARAIGGEVDARRIELVGIDTLRLEELSIRARGWPGEGGEVARFDEVLVRFSAWKLLIGALDVRSVEVGRALVRLAERPEEPGSLALLALTPDFGVGSDGGSEAGPDDVTIEELVVESGVVARGEYRPLGELRFRGALHPSADDRRAVRFSLTGRPDADGRLALASIGGTFATESRSLAVELAGLSLGERSLAIAPAAVRDWAERLGLEGTVRKARFAYAPESEPTAELDVVGLAMDLPIEALSGGSLEDAWCGLAGGRRCDLVSPPRMTLREGSLVLAGDRLELRGVRGELGAKGGAARVIPVPFECSFRVDLPRAALPAFDWEARDAWFEKALRLAPFQFDLAVRRFSSPEPAPGAPDVIQFPREVAKVLADFNVVKWTLDVETSVSRATPSTGGEPGAIRSTGTLRLENGSGAYDEFRYRLDDVEAEIRFDNDDVTIARLVGTGADGAQVSIDGTLVGVATGAEIDLRVRCDDAPIDARLFDAFEEAPRRALRLLFDEGAAGELAAAGLLPDGAHLEEQRAEIARLGSDAAGAEDRERLRRSVAAGPFALGGRCAFDLKVTSPAGFDQPVFVTGDVRVRDADLLFGRFPYPLRLREGAFHVLDEAIVIAGNGLEAVTPAGGIFTISGSVRIPRDGKGGRDGLPLIELSARDDAINPALLAAIPFPGGASAAPEGWPGRMRAPAAQLLGALGLTGTLSMGGVVSSDAAGREDFRIRLALAGGTVAPDADGRSFLAAEGLPWPTDFRLTDCSARVDVTPERVSFEQCTGRSGSGSVVARGFAELEGPGRTVELELRSLPIDRAFEGYLAPDPTRAAANFTRYGPSGALDGTIRRSVDAAGTQTTGSLLPNVVEVTLDGRRVRAERLAGKLALSGDALRADGLEFRLASGNQDDGILRLAGPLSADPSLGRASLEASLSNGRFDSPLVRELLTARAPGLDRWMRASSAAGRFDARYVGAPVESLEISPRRFSVHEGEGLIAVELDEGAKVSIVGESIDWSLAGRLAAGSTGAPPDAGLGGRLTTAGSIARSSDRYHAKASLVLDATRLTPALRDELPPPLDAAARAIDLASTGSFSLALPSIALEWPADGAPTSPTTYSLGGTVSMTGAAFDAGFRVEDFDGTLPLAFRYAPAEEPPFVFSSVVDGTKGRVLGRALGRTRTSIQSATKGESLAFQSVGDLALGRFQLDASVDFLADRYQAEARVADADFARIATPGLESPRGSQGRLSAAVSIKGATGQGAERSSRTGRGRASARDASLANAPIALRALQLTQFMLPMNASLDAFDAEFRIDGPRVVVERCDFASGTLRLAGTGEVLLPGFDVAMRLKARGTIPLVSDVVGGIVGQIFAIDVTGTLGDPRTSIAPLPGLSDVPTASRAGQPRQAADATRSEAPGAGP